MSEMKTAAQLAAEEIQKLNGDKLDRHCGLADEMLVEAIISRHCPPSDVTKLREALERLASICTCTRPSLPNPGGAVVAPGPHTSKCVCTIARAALASVPEPHRAIEKPVHERCDWKPAEPQVFASPPVPQVDTTLEQCEFCEPDGMGNHAPRCPVTLESEIENLRLDLLATLDKKIIGVTQQSATDEINRLTAELAHARKSQPTQGVNERLLVACLNLRDSKWEHRCSDKVGGCVAVSQLCFDQFKQVIRAAESAAVPNESMEKELADTVRRLLGSAHPNEKEHCAMFYAFESARVILARFDAKTEGGK